MEHTELKRGLKVIFNRKKYKVIQWYFDKGCRVEIMKGKWNPFWVNLSKLKRAWTLKNWLGRLRNSLRSSASKV